MTELNVNTLRVLLIEDNLIYADMVAEKVSAERNCTIRLTLKETLDQGIDALKRATFDLVLLDLGLPDCNGIETFLRIRSTEPLLPIIVLTGEADFSLASECVKRGAQDFLVKGRSERMIVSAILNTIARNTMQKELSSTKNKIERLNRVLSASRSIMQLTIHETDPLRLIQRACDTITKSAGYSRAWIAVSLEGDKPTFFAHSRWEPVFEEIEREINASRWPRCRDNLLNSRSELAIIAPSETCIDCPLYRHHEHDIAGAVAIRHKERTFGMMNVSLTGQMFIDKEEETLLLDIAGDIAFGLHQISLSRTNQANEARFKGVFEGVTDGLLLVDETDERFITANRSFCNMLGYEPREMNSLRLCDFHPKIFHSKIRESLTKIPEDGSGSTSDMLVLRKDGSHFYADISSRRIEMSGNSVLVVCYRDTTEKRQVQSSLAQNDRLSSMGMLAAGVAHEINNPLAYVLYNLECLNETLPRITVGVKRLYSQLDRNTIESAFKEFSEDIVTIGLPSIIDELHNSAKDALSGTNQIKTIARGLSTFSRVETTAKNEVDLKYTIECAISMAYNEIKYRARLVKDYGTIPFVFASDGSLSQVFLNLLINATHAIDDGDVDHNEIRVRTWSDDGNVFAEVKDTGKGIAKEDLEQIFDPFFSTKEKGRGSGLGLAISKSIITGYDGDISVESQVGKGTRFVIRLPSSNSRDTITRLSSVTDSEYRPSTSGKILVIDDEQHVRSAIKGMLSKYHEVITLSSVAEGKALLSEDQSFELILCDMMMPKISGMDLHIWLEDNYPHLADQMVFVTGGAFTPRTREYLTSKDVPYLEKPFGTSTLVRTVDQMISTNRFSDQIYSES